MPDSQNPATGRPPLDGHNTGDGASGVDMTQRMSSKEPEAPIGRVDRYAILEELGAGGFGAVYRARDDVAGLEVALKVLPRIVAHNPDELAKVRENFQLVAKLRHPHIANVTHLHSVESVDEIARDALGIEPGDHLIVMDYVRGMTIAGLRRRYPGNRVPVSKALRIAEKVGQALDYAHSQKIIHRDIKPANVIITAEEDVSILDFGLAAHIRSSISRLSQGTADTSGTPAYMAPEQWAGKPQGPHTDQYGLAVLVYEMLSGVVPFSSAFESNSRLVMFHAVKTEAPESIKRLSRKQNRAIRRALAKNPRDRFESCSAFVAALQGHAAPRLPRSAKRRRIEREPQEDWTRLAMPTAIVLLLLALVLIAGNWAYRQYQAVQGQREEQERLVRLEQARGRQIVELLGVAKAAFSNKEHAAASSAVKRLLELDPGNSEAEALQREIELAVGLAQVVPVSSEAEVRRTQLEVIDRGQGFGEAVDRARTLLDVAKVLFEAKQYNQALETYRQFLAECEGLQQLNDERQTATREHEAAVTAARRAEEANAQADAREVMTGAEQLSASAAEAFEKGDFGEAATLWIGSCAEFAKAEAAARGALAVRVAKTAYDDVLKRVDSDLLEQYGGAEWEQVKATVTESERLAREGKWSGSAETWIEARRLLQIAATSAAKARQKAQETPEVLEGEDALRRARVAQAIARAEEAKAAEDWAGVMRFVEEALDHDADSARAKALQNEAQDVLMPRLTISSEIGGHEINGAQVFIDGQELEERTPAKIRLERGKSYKIKVDYVSVRSAKRYVPFETVYRVEAGGAQELHAVLTETLLPADLVAAEDAQYAPLEGLAIGSGEAQERQRQAAGEQGLPVEARTRNTGIALRLVPAGVFLASAPSAGNRAAGGQEQGVQRIALTTAFYTGKYEVNRGQWETVVGNVKTGGDDKNYLSPVALVSWEECRDFCRRLCELEGVPTGTYRLPTEAEWEYACKAGTTSAYYTGDTESDAARAGWFAGNGGGNVRGCGQKAPNSWGIFDQHGNVWEWCQDWFGDYPPAGAADPTGPVAGTARVLRGGSCESPAKEAGSWSRNRQPPAVRNSLIGFRIVRQLKPVPASLPAAPDVP